MKLVAVTACPTGIAHTYMAAEQLERTGRNLGHVIQVETQGAMGVENALTEADLAGAEAVILAADIPVQGRDRFEGLRIVEVSVQQAIRNPVAIFQGLA
jgi:fructose-specific phosphotransferase system IIB component